MDHVLYTTSKNLKNDRIAQGIRLMANTELSKYIPNEIGRLENPQVEVPRLAKDRHLIELIEESVKRIPTQHDLYAHDARDMSCLEPKSVHLVVTSPPYWTLKKYPNSEGQLGIISEYKQFLNELDKVWKECFRVLVPGGRLVCVVGDVCLSRRKNAGRHTVVPLHSAIQVRCQDIGFDNLAPIIWYKISNISYEVENGSSFLGKPYEPNAIIKNDIEFILMERKPGGYRRPTVNSRILSVISEKNHQKWFRQIWSNLPGASTRHHPAPYPLELAERLIRMFSFVGDTVLDPFMGTGTTTLAALNWGRNSIGFEIDENYFKQTSRRIQNSIPKLLVQTTINEFGLKASSA